MITLIKKLVSGLILLSLSTVATADDIDIIDQELLINANVLFVMDLSGSMNWKLDDDKEAKGDSGDPSRLQVLRGAFQDIVADTDFDGINIGLTTFSGDAQSGVGKDKAHGIAYPVAPLIGTDAQDILSKPGFIHPDNSYMPAAGTNDTRQYLSLLSANTTLWDAGGKTPIVDALFEAARYFRGESVYWGRQIASDIRSAHPATYTGTLTQTSITVTPACTAASRVAVAKGSGGITESCTSTYVNQTRADATGGINCIVNTGNTTLCPVGVISCGLGTNCTPETNTYNRYCASNISTIAACQAANPSWHSCSTYASTSCTTNDEGITTCTSSTRVRCKEDLSLYRCDAVDNFSCDFPVESCTKCPDDTTTTTVDGTATYDSPIVDECSRNGIILLSDGFPTENQSASLVTTMIGGTYANSCDSGSADGRCGPELAEFLANEDHANGSTSIPNIDGKQNVLTYTVGLALPASSPASIYLNDIATKGNGAFVNANDRAELTAAFKQAITSITGQARTFAAPTYSVDTSTLLTHGDFVYLPLFDRGSTIWPGNLKKYRLVNGVLTDADGNAAIDASGKLIPSARDYWSAVASSDAIRSGGAANKINPATRKILTDNNNTGTAANLEVLNDSVSKSLLGNASMTDAYREDLIDYIRGENTDGSTRFHMGDIIHSKPVQLHIAGGRNIIFAGSNEGYLHAINDADGTEAFAYMPSELLVNIDKQFTGAATPKHIYGVDSPITLWIDESASVNPANIGNSILDTVDGEKAYLFFGLRRGGKSYFALEVTDPDIPALIWKNSYGSGDSWSQPVLTQLMWKPNTTPKPVLVFGGGYNEDASGIETAGGNEVFIVDAITGSQVWSTKVAEADTTLAPDTIDNAVPSRIRVIDVDRNGSVEWLYFGDTGGNLWRVDLNASNFNADTTDDNDISKATLHKFAELGGSGADNRKFFEEPDVAIFRRGGKLVATVSIGSGDRSHPLDATVNDHFFVLYDKQVLSLPTASTITKGDLKAAPVSVADVQDPTFTGWYKDLTSLDGEKVLSTAVTFQNKVLFTTFGTSSVIPDACSPSNVNQARLYIMDLIFATEDTNIQASTGEILGTPQIIFDGFESETGGVCVQGDCIRKYSVRAGKIGPIALPPLPAGSAMPDALPRVYWIDNEQ